MKSYITALSFFLYTVTFNIFAQNVCDVHPLPERTQSFFLYGIDIDQNQLNHQIIHQVKINNHVVCNKDNTSYQQEDIFKGYKEDIVKEIKAAAPDSDEEKQLKTTLESITEQLTKIDKKLNGLEKKLNAECIIPPSVNPILNADLPKCLTLLKQQIENEVKQYPINQIASDGADATEKKRISDSNIKNKHKRKLAISDLRIIERFSPSDELEESPDPIGIIKNTIREGDFGANTNVLLDVLDEKSAEMAFFRQKIKVLERNSRILISRFDFSEKCEAFKTKKRENKIDFFITINEKIKNTINAMTEYEKNACNLATDLTEKLNKTLQLSYEDSWFENINITSAIKDIELLLKKLDKLEASKDVSVVKQINFLNHANQYIAKYNGTGRFNIGLGAALFNAPQVINPIDVTLDLSQFTSSALESQLLQDDITIPSGKKLSPVIVATMPWFDATITLPDYSKSYTYVSTINAWPLPLAEGQESHNFLSQTTIESTYKIDYDINLTFKIFSFLRDNCTYWCHGLNNITKDKSVELAVGLGITDLQLTKAVTTDIREQVDLEKGYAQLAALHQIEAEETIDHSMQYLYVGGHYYMADQIRLEAYWKRYKNDYKKGEIQLNSRTSWGVSVVYLFF